MRTLRPKLTKRLAHSYPGIRGRTRSRNCSFLGLIPNQVVAKSFVLWSNGWWWRQVFSTFLLVLVNIFINPFAMFSELAYSIILRKKNYFILFSQHAHYIKIWNIQGRREGGEQYEKYSHNPNGVSSSFLAFSSCSFFFMPSYFCVCEMLRIIILNYCL